MYEEADLSLALIRSTVYNQATTLYKDSLSNITTLALQAHKELNTTTRVHARLQAARGDLMGLHLHSADVPPKELGSEPVDGHQTLVAKADLAVCLKAPPQQACMHIN